MFVVSVFIFRLQKKHVIRDKNIAEKIKQSEWTCVRVGVWTFVLNGGNPVEAIRSTSDYAEEFCHKFVLVTTLKYYLQLFCLG